MAVSPEMAARVALYRLSVEDAPPTYQSISDLRFFCGAVKRKMTLSMLLRQHNNSGRRLRRTILFAIRLDAVLENCIFYISPMYEFLHSLDYSLPMRLVPASHDVRDGLKADVLLCY